MLFCLICPGWNKKILQLLLFGHFIKSFCVKQDLCVMELCKCVWIFFDKSLLLCVFRIFLLGSENKFTSLAPLNFSVSILEEKLSEKYWNIFHSMRYWRHTRQREYNAQICYKYKLKLPYIDCIIQRLDNIRSPWTIKFLQIHTHPHNTNIH